MISLKRLKVFDMLSFPKVLIFLRVITQTVYADEVSDALKPTPTATVASGQIIGTTTQITGATGSVTINKYLGIPYAAPPTGTNRFSTPQPPTKWTTPLSTTKYASSCVQVFAPLSFRNFTEAVFNNPAPAESEDCLYINVYAPKKSWNITAPPYPVMYWMYGGAWEFGNAGQPWYDGSHFAALEDAVLVSVNYRTNVFGFPISPTTDLKSQNLGMLDQRAGLQWVQDNIVHFGGDKNRVTIFGQSAGAFAVDALITSYASGASRPFQAAIMQSGVYAYLVAPVCNNADYASWNSLATALKCTGTDAQIYSCVKSATAAQLKSAQEADPGITFGKACDEVTMVSNPRTRLEAGNTANVPVMLGTNTEDGSFYSFPYGLNTTAYMNTYFPGNAAFQQQVLAAYPIGSEGRTDAQYQLAQIHTDWFFHCPAVWYGQASSTFKPTYRYLFSATFTNTRAQESQWLTQYQGAYHTSEIPIVFSSYSTSNVDATEPVLSNTMRGAWAAFARNPNAAPISNWPKVGSAAADVYSFGTSSSGAVSDTGASRCMGTGVWAPLRTYHA
ncbi:alpha/beta-hydrolase [Microthyrium microscopicum]|uniref:Carboxylic ester hydrolase n=1 Tax=Microthyrium microscopicum TaxID=703497 RepID=A0A6A6UID3_9PEZI|nr:alpha/beta-hydrolase [Microthyrium microscopicum]